MSPNVSAEYAVCIKHCELIDQVVGKKIELVPGELVKIIVLNRSENLDRLVVKIYDRDNKNFGKGLYQCDKEVLKRLADNVWNVASNLRVGTNVTLHFDLPDGTRNIQFLIKFYGNCTSLRAGRYFGLDINNTLKISDDDKFKIQMQYYMANHEAYIIRADKLIEALVLENLATIDDKTTKPIPLTKPKVVTEKTVIDFDKSFPQAKLPPLKTFHMSPLNTNFNQQLPVEYQQINNITQSPQDETKLHKSSVNINLNDEQLNIQTTNLDKRVSQGVSDIPQDVQLKPFKIAPVDWSFNQQSSIGRKHNISKSGYDETKIHNSQGNKNCGQIESNMYDQNPIKQVSQDEFDITKDKSDECKAFKMQPLDYNSNKVPMADCHNSQGNRNLYHGRFTKIMNHLKKLFKSKNDAITIHNSQSNRKLYQIELKLQDPNKKQQSELGHLKDFGDLPIRNQIGFEKLSVPSSILDKASNIEGDSSRKLDTTTMVNLCMPHVYDNVTSYAATLTNGNDNMVKQPINLLNNVQSDLNQNTTNYSNMLNCLICQKTVEIKIQLDCQHVFCGLCWVNSIDENVENAYCPFQTENFKCPYKLTMKDIWSIIESFTEPDSVSSSTPNTARNDNQEKIDPDFFVYEDDDQNSEVLFYCKQEKCGECWFVDKSEGMNTYQCPKCEKFNCFKCQVIHDKMTCEEYNKRNAVRNNINNFQIETQRSTSEEGAAAFNCAFNVKDTPTWKCEICNYDENRMDTAICVICLKINDRIMKIRNNSSIEYQAMKHLDCQEHNLRESEYNVTKIQNSYDTKNLYEGDIVRQGKVYNYAQAENYSILRKRNPDYEEGDLIWAIKQNDDINLIEQSLNVQCCLCIMTFAHNKIFSMMTCDHVFCNNCAKSYFTTQITEKTIRDCVCPICSMPKFDDDSSESEYFEMLDALLKIILEQDVYDIFSRKTRDRALARLPNFKWCVKCDNGFEVNPNMVNAACKTCATIFCISCNEIWQEQHAGITCAQFKLWKQENDPNTQATGVAKYLEENGIVCPSPTCNFKYSLAKGGCLHFTCTQCKHEFCFGCRQPFLREAQCKKYNDCANKGIHAHHPRNCISILRDCSIASLENLIKKVKINFNGIPPNGTTCQIPIQKETPNGFVDVLCEQATHNANTGLCDQHYQEGIIDVIFKAKLDPVDILDLGECQGELIRNNVAPPKRLATDTDAAYRKKCVATIKQLLPIV